MNTLLEVKKKTILTQLKESQILYQQDCNLSKYSTFKVGGKAMIIAMPNTIEQLRTLYQIIFDLRIPYFFLGGGSNILFSDSGFDGLVIQYKAKEEIIFKDQTEDSILVSVPSNARVAWFAKQISKKGYTGVEFLTTIPGQIGGAVIQNAGCYGQEICDVLYAVHIIHQSQHERFITKECQFSYRDSLFKQNPNLWVTAVDFLLYEGELKTIIKTIDKFTESRLNSQPKNRRSAGSIFKNPPHDITHLKAWELIKESDLSHASIGGAQVSPEHYNFIVNSGHATAKDIFSLMCHIEEKVRDITGVSLEREVILVGQFFE